MLHQAKTTSMERREDLQFPKGIEQGMREVSLPSQLYQSTPSQMILSVIELLCLQWPELAAQGHPHSEKPLQRTSLHLAVTQE